MNLSSPILEVKNLHKSYGNLHAVRGVNFCIQSGTCFGLLGPNGAGKTTTIEMMEGMILPSQGEVLFRGRPLDKNYSSHVGIQFQQTALPDFMKVSEAVELFAALYSKGLPVSKVKELCKLDDIWNQEAKKISGGQRQRLLLAMAIVGDPDLFFLDEPTAGMDPQARREFWVLVKTLKSQRKTIILTTHYMDEAYQLCDEIVIVDKGQVIAQGEPNKLLSQYFHGQFVVVDHQPGKEAGFKAAQLELSQDRKVWSGTCQDIVNLINVLAAYQIDLTSLSVRAPTLDDLFLILTGVNRSV